MDRRLNNNRAGTRVVFLVFCLAFLPAPAIAAGVEVDGASDTSVDAAANGVPVVDIAKPNARGLSHNTYRKFNVDRSGLILNNSSDKLSKTRLGGYILGNGRLETPARVILNEVTSTHRSRLEGFTEVAGQRADVVIANPNGLSINGAGFINARRVTLTTGKPLIDGSGALTGFDVLGGEISIGGDGLDTTRQDATSIYSYYLQLNASLHARDLDIVLGENQVDYPGRKIVRRGSGQGKRVLLDASALGGMYAGKIRLVGTASGLGINLPPEVIASSGDIEISADGRIRLQQLDAAGRIAVESSARVVSGSSVYAGDRVRIDAPQLAQDAGSIAAANEIAVAAERIDIGGSLIAGLEANGGRNEAGEVVLNARELAIAGEIGSTGSTLLAAESIANGGRVGAARELTLNAAQMDNGATLIAGVDIDGALNGAGNLRWHGDTLVNSGEIGGTESILLAGAVLANHGLVNTDGKLELDADELTNTATLYAGGDIELRVRDELSNETDAAIFAFGSLSIAADEDQGRTGQVTNRLGLMQTLDGDIEIHATRFDNAGAADIRFKKQYFDLGNRRKVSSIGKAKAIDLSYHSGYTKHRSEARRRWTQEILKRLEKQAPYLYDDNAPDIIADRYARFLAIETRVVDRSTTTPAYLDSGADLRLDVDAFYNRDSVVAAAADIVFDVGDTYRNIARTKKIKVKDYEYYVRASHKMRSDGDDRYSSKGKANYLPLKRTETISSNTVTQAGGSLRGNIAGKAVNSGVRRGSHVAGGAIDPGGFDTVAITLPQGDYGLFVRSSRPDARFLIETNPRFTRLGNFAGTDYLMERLDYSGSATLKRLGDASYEARLIRDSLFAQTGRRYLDASIADDRQQFQYLMDNAIAAQRALELSPGVELTRRQINRLGSDIVWLVATEVGGETVLAPRVYLASTRNARVRGGRILAGGDLQLQVGELDNDGLIEAARDIALDAAGDARNRGVIEAGENLALAADGDIENLSGSIRGGDVEVVSRRGDIVNRRSSERYDYRARRLRYSTTLVGEAGAIEAERGLKLDAAGEIRVEGSQLAAGSVDLEAASIDIATTETGEEFFSGYSKNSVRESAAGHLTSTVVGDEIVLLSRGRTRISGSRIEAGNGLRVDAGEIEIAAVNQSDYFEKISTDDGMLSDTLRQKKTFRSANHASVLSGATVVLVTERGDIELTGSELVAGTRLSLDSAGEVRVAAGYDGSLDEKYKHESGWFSGGSLYSESEDLEGRVTTTAVSSRIQAGGVEMRAGGDIELEGAEISVAGDFDAEARDITIKNALSEETRYARHTEIDVGLGDAVRRLGSIGDFIEEDDGKLGLRLAEADYERMESVETQQSAVGSRVEARNIRLEAGIDEDGDILVEGSDLLAAEDIDLAAGRDVALLDARQLHSNETSTQSGTAVLSVTLQNEYDQAMRALQKVRDAERDLRRANDAYSDYKRDLRRQETAFEQLKADFASGTGFVERADLRDFERRLRRLRDDDEYYQVNIALAAATLASRGTQLVKQTGRAAASSGTAGFNLGVDLDVDAIERSLQSNYRQARATNLAAGASITISAGEQARLRGSHLQAVENIDIAAEDIEIRAGTETADQRAREQHVNYSYSWDALGGGGDPLQAPGGGIDARDLGSGFGGGGRRDDSESTRQINSTLLARNVSLRADDDTDIEGADIHAENELSIETGNLSIASAQHVDYSASRSQGLSYSGAGSGVNAAEDDAETVQTQLTRLTGSRVEIDVRRHTELQGAMIAAVDDDGADNGQLSFSTETLAAGSLNNTMDGADRAAGVNYGEVSSLDYRDGFEYEKTKTLATLGRGDIEIRDTAGSDTRFLNTDIGDTEVSIAEFESQRGLSGELDVRMLSEHGRRQIAEDLLKSSMIANTVGLIATNDRVGIEDFFSQTEIDHRSYEALKRLVQQDPVVAAMLNNPALDPGQKRNMLDQVIGAVMQGLGYEAHENLLIATEGTGSGVDRIFGFYSQQTGQAYINDLEHEDTRGLIATAGHEAVHAMDDQAGVDLTDDSIRDDNNTYADDFGANLADYADFALDYFGHDGLAASNDHVGNDAFDVRTETAVFERLDHRQGDFRQLHLAEGRLIMLSAAAFAQQQGITPAAAVERLRAQAMRDIDSAHDDGLVDGEAATWLANMSVAYLKGREDQFDLQLFAATEAQRQDHSLFREHRDGVDEFLLAGSEIADSEVMRFINAESRDAGEVGELNFSRLGAMSRIEIRGEAFAETGYGSGDLIYGYLDANGNLQPIEKANAYESVGAIVLNPNEINQILTGNLDKGFDLEYVAAVQALGLNPRLIDRDSHGGAASWGSAPGQQDVLAESIRYLTADSPTPLLVIDNGNTGADELSGEVLDEIGGYPESERLSGIDQSIRTSAPGEILNLSDDLERATALTVQATANSMTGFNEHVQNEDGLGAFVTSSWTGMVEQTIRNWDIVAGDENAPQYMQDSARAGVALDLVTIAPVVKGLSSTVKGGARQVDDIDLSLAGGYRELRSAGAAVSQSDLPKGYSRVVLQNGDHAILGPRGGIYTETDRVDQFGNPLYKDKSRHYYSMDGRRNNVKTGNLTLHDDKIEIGTSRKDFTGQIDSSGNTLSSIDFSKLSVTTGIEEAVLKDVVKATKGKRPEPSAYMTKEQIRNHLDMFKEGGVRIISKSKVKDFGSVGPPGGVFIIPKSYYDEVVSKSKGNKKYLEEKLGLPDGYLNSNDIGIVEIPKPSNLRMPSGNETGANELWLPGGTTSGGIPEAVIDTPKLDQVIFRDIEKE